MLSHMKWSRIVLVVLVALTVGVISGCSDDDPVGPRNDLAQYDSEVVTAWFDLFLDITATERLTPPVASRAFAYQGVALYEAVVPGLGTHQSLAGQLNGLAAVPQPIPGAGYHWPSVANAALATVARQLYSGTSAGSLSAINDLEESFNSEFEALAGTTVFTRSAAHGTAVGNAIYNWAFADGYSQNHNCLYVPPQGTGLWVPTPPAFAPALEPCWGNQRNFVLDIPERCDPLPPPPFDEHPQSPFYAEMAEVYNVTTSLTTDQRDIALFWADGAGTVTPPGHWLAILSQLTVENEWTLDVSCEAYAKLGIAMGEAFITCWRVKYLHNLMRPVTCIQSVFDPAWMPLVVTPPFPEFPSGHSTQSGAAAQVLTDMFGHIPFVDHTHDARGLTPRAFASFFDAATEAMNSRLYGGIHFRSGNQNGFASGVCVGQKVSAVEFLR